LGDARRAPVAQAHAGQLDPKLAHVLARHGESLPDVYGRGT
jgi:hypothetical protein